MLNDIEKLNNKGFTIIELVISIFVLSIAIIGAYNAFTAMNIITSNSSDRLVAAYLAQEGMEIVRNIRDTNWINSSDWMAGLADDSIDCVVNGCEADYNTYGTSSSSPLTVWSEGQYFYMDENGFYSYDTSGTKTKFKRRIYIDPLETPGGDPDVLRVTVVVYWDTKSSVLFGSGSDQGNSITVKEYLYNWY